MLTVKTFTFNPVQENTYLLYNDKGECCIIDPGCYFDEEKTILRQAVENGGLTPVLLLNTHCHLDHVFGNQFVYDTWGLQPHIHEKERPVLDRAAEAGMRWQLPFVNYTGPVHLLAAGDQVQLGDDTMTVLFTPGHSPGSISYYCAAQHFVIGGDVLFQGSIGRTDLPGGDYETLIDSIKTQLLPMADDTIVYSGHGPATTIGRERRNNPFLQD